MTSLILAITTLLIIVAISIFARIKGQSGLAVFFLLYSIVSIIVHFITGASSNGMDLMKIMPQIGVIVCASGIIYAQAKGLKKLPYAIPGLVIIGIVLMMNMPSRFAGTENATNSTTVLNSTMEK
jgi:hypothetical protein